MVKKVDVIVETGKDLFSCFLSNDSSDIGIGLCGDGKTVQAAIEDFYVCYEEARQDFKENGKVFPNVEFRFIFDVGAFFAQAICRWHQGATGQELEKNKARHCQNKRRFRRWSLDR
jgi:hypothetical protein